VVPYSDWYQKVKETVGSTSKHLTLANLLYLLDALVMYVDT